MDREQQLLMLEIVRELRKIKRLLVWTIGTKYGSIPEWMDIE